MDIIKSSSGNNITRSRYPLEDRSAPQPIDAVDFFSGIKAFSDEHLSGLVKFSYNGLLPPLSYVNADVVYTAHFFKELLFCVRAKELIYVNFKNDTEYFGADIFFDGLSKLPESTKERLKVLIGAAGFDFKITDRIVIKTKLAKINFALVYAVGTKKISKLFENVMFDLHNR